MSFSKEFCGDSPFHQKKSRKEAKKDYIAMQASEKLDIEDGIEEINKAQDDATTSYKNLSRKEKKALRT